MTYTVVMDDEDYYMYYLQNAYQVDTSRNDGSPRLERHYKENGINHVVQFHREIMHAGPGEIVDHINGNTLDDRKCNLRIVDKWQSSQNRKKRSDGNNKYVGVHSHKNRFRVELSAYGEKIRLYGFTNEEQAARARDILAKLYHGACARMSGVTYENMTPDEIQQLKNIADEHAVKASMLRGEMKHDHYTGDGFGTEMA
jgi:hypothetical protein